MFETHTAPLADFYVLAQLLIEFDLTGISIPHEEGWQSVEDLSGEEWRQLETIYRSMQHTRFI